MSARLTVQLITRDRERVATVAVPSTSELPTVVLWEGRAFYRYAGTGGRELADGDIYRECLAVEGHAIEAP
jgi:hypothetical protein